MCFVLGAFALSHYDTGRRMAPLPGNTVDTVDANSYALRVQAEADELICLRSLAFGTSALATSCAEADLVLQDQIVDVSITSDADLSARHPAGDELKSLFLAGRISRFCQSFQDGSQTCTVSYNTEEYSLEDYFNQRMAYSFYFQTLAVDSEDDIELFALRVEERLQPQSHRFSLRLTFRSGRTVALTTDPIALR